MTSMPKQLPAPAKRSPLGWWLDELGSLLPKSGRRSDQMARACLLRLEGEALRIVELRRGAEQELGRVLLPGEGIDTTVDPDLVKQVRSRSGRVRLVLRPNDGLAVSDRLPAGAEGDAALIMRHKIDILTPGRQRTCSTTSSSPASCRTGESRPCWPWPRGPSSMT